MEESPAQRLRAQLAQWVKLVPEPVLILDVKATVLVANSAAEEFLGWTRDELAGRVLSELAVEPVEEIEGYVRASVRSGDLITRRLTLRTRDARELECGCRGSLLHPVGGEFDPVVLLRLDPTLDAVDVAEEATDHRLAELRLELDRRRRVQSDLRASQARLRAIVDTAVDAIIVIDHRGTIESVNRATESMFGYAAEEMIQRNVTMLMPSPFREEHDSYLRNFLETGDAKIIGIGREVKARRKDGTSFPIYLAVSEVPVEGRRLFAGIVRDLTDQYHLLNQIRRQEKLAVVGQLASGIAHEIGNPLSSISAVVQNLRRKVSDQAVVQKLELIERHISRLVNITRQISQLGRPMSPDRVRCSINAAIENGVSLLQYDKRAADVEFDVGLDPDLPTVVGVPDELAQVFMNLGLNAIDALNSQEGASSKRLTIRTSVTEATDGDSSVCVTIADNGPGMDEDVVHRVFDPFFTTKDPGQGTGLGLSVSYRIVEEHGGRLRVESSPGEGASFTVELPVGADAGR